MDYKGKALYFVINVTEEESSASSLYDGSDVEEEEDVDDDEEAENDADGEHNSKAQGECNQKFFYYTQIIFSCVNLFFAQFKHLMVLMYLI